MMNLRTTKTTETMHNPVLLLHSLQLSKQKNLTTETCIAKRSYEPLSCYASISRTSVENSRPYIEVLCWKRQTGNLNPWTPVHGVLRDFEDC
jgi:hypothetical protein